MYIFIRKKFSRVNSLLNSHNFNLLLNLFDSRLDEKFSPVNLMSQRATQIYNGLFTALCKI